MSLIVDGPGGALEVHVHGEGPAVVMLPSLGRGADDFEDLAGRITAAGFRAIRPEPRGVGGSTAELEGVTMHDLAADVAAVIGALDAAPAVVVGHALGNRIARMVATEHPGAVESVVLLACGGRVPPSPEASAALAAVFDPELGHDEHLDAVRMAFFAPGNDPSIWFDGWHGAVAAAQRDAVRGTPVDVWWAAGSADVLVVQPEDDVIAVRANADDIVAVLGDRARLVVIAHAGHALLPEQPELVARAVIDWVNGRPAV